MLCTTDNVFQVDFRMLDEHSLDYFPGVVGIKLVDGGEFGPIVKVTGLATHSANLAAFSLARQSFSPHQMQY